MVLEFPEQEGPIRIEKLHVAPFSSRLVSESHLQATRSLVLSPSAHMARCLLVSLEEVEAGLGQSVVAVEFPGVSRSLGASDGIDLATMEVAFGTVCERDILATGPPRKSQGSLLLTKEGRNWLALRGICYRSWC